MIFRGVGEHMETDMRAVLSSVLVRCCACIAVAKLQMKLVGLVEFAFIVVYIS